MTQDHISWLTIKPAFLDPHLEARAELHHLLGLDVLKTIDTSDTISNGEHTASLLKVDGGGSAQDSLLEDGGDLSRSSLSSIDLL